MEAQTISRADVVEAARSFVGAEFKHQGRNERRMDCVGTVKMTGQKLGIRLQDYTRYPMQPNPEEFMRRIRESGMVEIELDAAQLGTVLVFEYKDERPMHVGIVVQEKPLRVVHAWRTARKVCEGVVPFAATAVYAFDYPGVE